MCRASLAAAFAATVLLACGSETGPATELHRRDATSVLRAARAVPGQYLVVFRDARVNAASVEIEADDLARRHDGAIVAMWRHAVRGFAARMTQAQAQALAKDPRVAWVEEDAEIHLDATQTGATWGLDRIDQRNRPLDGNYTYNVDGTGVNAYIIDTGIRTTHAEFGGRASSAFTAVNDGNGTNDCNGHGTHVAGTVGGSTYGVAKNVRLFAVRVLDCNGSGTTSGVISGVDWVTTNHLSPAVANMSLGGGASATLDQAVQNSINSGVTYAIAAGNSNVDACTQSPAAFSTKRFPAGACTATLSFWLWITTSETTTTTAFDKLTVTVRNTAGTVLSTLATFSNLNKSASYVQRSFDVSAFKGQTVRIQFRGVEDSSLQTSFLIDDTALTVTQ